MTNLLTTLDGRIALNECKKYLLERRMARFFKRNLVIDLNANFGGANFDLATIADNLNTLHDAEIIEITRLLSLSGGMDKLWYPTDIHVDAVNGDDETGTGSTTRPYASLWFLNMIPRIMRYALNIYIHSDISTSSFLNLDIQFDQEGALNFIGVGAAIDPFGGGLNGAINAVTLENQTWQELDVTTPPGGPVMRAFLNPTSGPEAGNAAPVCGYRNAALNDYLAVRAVAMGGLGVGNTYSFAIPANTLQIKGGTIASRCAANNEGNPEGKCSRINFVNLNIDITGGVPGALHTFVTQGDPMGFWFCRLEVPNDASTYEYSVVFQNDINHYNPITDNLDTFSQAGIGNMFLFNDQSPMSCGMMIVNRDPLIDEFAYNEPILQIEKDAFIQCVDCMGGVRCFRSNAYLKQCCAKGLIIENSNVGAEQIACDAGNIANNYSIRVINSTFYLYNSLLGESNYGIQGIFSRIKCDTSGGDAGGIFTAMNYALYFSEGCKSILHNAWVGTSGGVNDIWFPDGILASIFPGIGGWVLDGITNDCARAI